MTVKTILVPTDFSDSAQAAFDVACDLATQLGAKVRVLHVKDESALRIAIKEGLLDACSTDEQLQAAVEKLTENRFSKMISTRDCSTLVEARVTQRGDPDYLIVAHAREVGADMIVIGRRGAGRLKDIVSAVAGSVTEAVIRKAPCPVLVVRREHKKADEGEAAN